MSQVRPIEELFAELLELKTPGEREAYLDRVCSDDGVMRGQLKKLLEAYEKAGSFLKEGESVEATVGLDHDNLIGSMIGPYKLREVLGEGGMGTVYVAEQFKPLRRKVAVKVIKPGMDSKAVIARFEAERNALAMMNHPNIAKVLDAGATEQGRPFFAMELVSGIPITEYCDEHKLSVTQRLELFVHVCQAMQHAHQKGIIHRDVKPSNVLVTELDGKPVPKVIDFGVAKALNQSLTDQSIYTSHQSIIGTPLYMSPEQASLSAVDVDTRSDVYSLGVLLYELLTGTTPLEHSRMKEAAQHEVLRIIREEEPPRPSNRISTLGNTATRISQLRQTQPDRLGRQVKGDLDWIVMTAMAKERSRRYESASRFADDVRHYLVNEVVDARPPSSWYQLRKVYQRNKALTMSAAAIFVALITGLVLAIAGQRAASIARDDAVEQREIAVEQTEIAKQRLAQVQAITFEFAFYDALLNHSVNASLLRADGASLTKEQTESLLGLQAFYAEQHDEAIRHFELGERSIPTLAMKAWSQTFVGDKDGIVDSITQMNDLQPTTAEDHLMLGQIYAWLRPEVAVSHINKACELKGSRSTIFQIAYSLALANLAVMDGRLDQALEAAEIINAARTLHPNSEFIEAQSVHINFSASEVAKRFGPPEEAERLLTIARGGPSDATTARFDIPLLEAEGRYSDAMDTYEERLVRQGFLTTRYAAAALLAKQPDRAIKFLEQLPTNFYRKIALAYLYSQDSNPQQRVEGAKIAKQILHTYRDSNTREMALEVLLLADVPSTEVAEIARNIEGDTIELFSPLSSIRYFARLDENQGKPLEAELDAGVSHYLKFVNGLRYLSRDQFELGQAVDFLEDVEQHSVGGHRHLWATYLLEKVRSAKEEN